VIDDAHAAPPGDPLNAVSGEERPGCQLRHTRCIAASMHRRKRGRQPPAR
jgi:hypothetical protein